MYYLFIKKKNYLYYLKAIKLKWNFQKKSMELQYATSYLSGRLNQTELTLTELKPVLSIRSGIEDGIQLLIFLFFLL